MAMTTWSRGGTGGPRARIIRRILRNASMTRELRGMAQPPGPDGLESVKKTQQVARDGSGRHPGRVCRRGPCYLPDPRVDRGTAGAPGRLFSSATLSTPTRLRFQQARTGSTDLDMSLTMAQGMKRLGTPIAALLGVALIGLIGTSWFLNRDALRQAVEAQIRAVTGLDLELKGHIDVSVFPGSYVSFHEVGL